MNKYKPFDCGCTTPNKREKELGNIEQFFDDEDDAFLLCKSCGYKSCLDCQHITRKHYSGILVGDRKCKEGYGCNTPQNKEE